MRHSGASLMRLTSLIYVFLTPVAVIAYPALTRPVVHFAFPSPFALPPNQVPIPIWIGFVGALVSFLDFTSGFALILAMFIIIFCVLFPLAIIIHVHTHRRNSPFFWWLRPYTSALHISTALMDVHKLPRHLFMYIVQCFIVLVRFLFSFLYLGSLAFSIVFFPRSSSILVFKRASLFWF